MPLSEVFKKVRKMQSFRPPYPNELELYHHGILGQKWGTKNGPPYPLDASDHSASERKAGWRKSLDSNSPNKTSRPTGHRKSTSTGSVSVKRRGSGLGTGAVGRGGSFGGTSKNNSTRNRPTAHQKNTVSGTVSVKRRGYGLGTGPVGNSGGSLQSGSNNRPTSHQKNVVEGTVTVYKREEGLGTGPVGQQGSLSVVKKNSNTSLGDIVKSVVIAGRNYIYKLLRRS